MSSASQASSKRWPEPGDQLVHKIRGRDGEVVAEVLSVNRDNGNVSVKIGGEVYTSLSAAAKSIGGYETNGWIFWGLKTQGFRSQRKNTSG